MNCSTLWERAAGSSPNTSQVSLISHWQNAPWIDSPSSVTWLLWHCQWNPPGKGDFQMMKITPCQAHLHVMLSGYSSHRSHFGSRYKLGCCGHASLFATCGGSILDAFRNQKATRVQRTRWEGWPNNMVRTEGVTSARHPYTCGSIPQHNTILHRGSAEPSMRV